MTKNNILSNRIIFFLSLLGLIMAVYVLQSFLRQTGIVCVNNGCELVRKSPYSYLFGIPVPAFGLVGYSIMVIVSFLRTVKDNPLYLKIILGIGIFGICFTSWFTYTEIFIIKGICTWCAISAVNMWVIFIITLRSFIHSGKILK